jgi:Zn-dependent metalloprotease
MNKKTTFTLLTLGFFSAQLLISQSNQRLASISKDYTVNDKNEIDFIRLDRANLVYETNAEAFLNNTVLTNNVKAKMYTSAKDDLGFTHSRYQLNYNNVPVHNTQVIVHSRDGKIVSLSGTLNDLSIPVNGIAISEQKALQTALKKVNAKKYKWEDKALETQLRKSFNNPDFSYSPKAEIIIYPKENKSYYAYKFAIYADEPLYGANVIVDAQSGVILAEEQLIHTADVPATATTKYSSVQTLTVDNVSAGLYRLRETGRGLGIETYDLNTSTSTGAAVDYTNTSTAWTNTTTIDQIGTDAHWGAEMTYDYYWNIHNRNSINNAGFKLISYADYGVGYQNAFWNGAYMTYGSGASGGFVGLDICGHEITHGLTGMTAGLLYQSESGALNESYSDIMGQCIEWYAKPLSATWILGETTGGIRNMANPSSKGDPDTYGGIGWVNTVGCTPSSTNDQCGVHTNSGVSNFWFYLLSTGGTGINDLSTSYTVTGLGLINAARIAFRALTVYYGPSTNYASARNLSVQAAIDLFGPCSNEVYETKNAWYAVGVGGPPSGTMTPTANFTSVGTLMCSLPFTANFYNTSLGADTYVWDFGDGSAVSTATNPIHTYTANGTYNVKLKSTSACAATPDSIIKNAYVVINSPPAPTTTDDSRCGTGTVNLTASGTGLQYWYTSPTATGSPVFIGTNYTPTISSTTSYYVVNTFTNPAIFGGPSSPTIGTGANFPGSTAYDSLTVFQPCKLKTVMVQASSTANRTIQLRNNMNVVLQSTVVNIPAGISTVTVNFNLTPGYGYRLGLGPGTAQLYRNNGGVSYPYNIGGLVDITGSSQGPNYHFYFYNWEVEPGDCKSDVIASTGTILPGSGLTVNSSTICSGQNVNLIANGATSYTWDTGANTSSISVSPSVTTSYTVSSNTPSCGLISLVTTVSVNTTPVVTSTVSTTTACTDDGLISLVGTPGGGIFTGTGVSGNNFNPGIGIGTYTVSYNYTDPTNGCSAIAAKTITVAACVGINELNTSLGFKIYPNPANDFITLTTEKEIDISVKVYDATGKMLVAKQLNGKSNRIDITALAKGIYFMEAQDADKNTYRQKIVKQ